LQLNRMMRRTRIFLQQTYPEYSFYIYVYICCWTTRYAIPILYKVTSHSVCRLGLTELKWSVYSWVECFFSCLYNICNPFRDFLMPNLMNTIPLSRYLCKCDITKLCSGETSHFYINKLQRRLWCWWANNPVWYLGQCVIESGETLNNSKDRRFLHFQMEFDPLVAFPIQMAIQVPAFFCNLLILLILYQRRDLRNPWNLVTVTINIGNFFYSIICLGVLSSTFYYYPDHVPKGVCDAQGFALFTTANFNSLSLCLVAMERYRTICLQKPWPTTSWVSLSLCILTYSVALSFVALFDPAGAFTLSITRTYCMIPWYAHSVNVKICAVMSLLNGAFCTSVLNFCYLRIFQKYRLDSISSTRAKPASAADNASVVDSNVMSSSEAPPSPQPNKKRYVPRRRNSTKEGRNQRHILVTSVTYISVYVICWTPFIILIMYELASQSPINAFYHIFCDTMAGLSSSLNPLCLIWLTPTYKSHIASWFSRT
jgi:hypothetical protein